jgi:hypothetical protein
MPTWTQNPELNPTKVPTAIDIAWAAGIYEGEGHLRQQRYGAATAQVTQKEPEILYKLRDWFGGAVRFAQCSTVPIEHQCHLWRVCGDKSRLFIAQVYGFLSSRRKAQVDATRTLEFLHGESPVGMSHEQLKGRLETFDLSRRKQGNSPEEKREYKNRKRNIRRALARQASANSTHERVM